MAQDRFTGKIAFVTGGGAGIGRATALAFAAEGAQIAVVDKAHDKAVETVQAIEATGGRALAIACDTAEADQVQAALSKAVAEFGGIDIAFNNAGVEQEPAKVADLDEAEWDRIVNTDLRGTFLCMKYEIPHLLQRGGGSIINISSGAGVRAVPEQSAYTAAKFAVVGLTQAAALEYVTQNVRINAICPGNIDTSMMERVSGGTDEGYKKVISQEPVGRLGRPEEIAAAALYLCSDAAAFTVGLAMSVDGGQSVGLN